MGEFISNLDFIPLNMSTLKQHKFNLLKRAQIVIKHANYKFASKKSKQDTIRSVTILVLRYICR